MPDAYCRDCYINEKSTFFLLYSAEYIITYMSNIMYICSLSKLSLWVLNNSQSGVTVSRVNLQSTRIHWLWENDLICCSHKKLMIFNSQCRIITIICMYIYGKSWNVAQIMHAKCASYTIIYIWTYSISNIIGHIYLLAECKWDHACACKSYDS